MSESESECGHTYEDENEHFQVHLIHELMNVNTQLGQANIMQKETHNLMQEHISAIKEQTFVNCLSLMCLSLSILAIVRRYN